MERVAVVCVVVSMTAAVEAGALDCDSLPPPPGISFDSIAVFQYSRGYSCWGWIAPDGSEYAIYGADSGVAFVDVESLQEAAFLNLGSSGHPLACDCREMKTYRHYCYQVEDSRGMSVIDLQYLPDSVRLVRTFKVPNHWTITSWDSIGPSHTISIDTSRGFAYIHLFQEIYILSLADPENPLLVGRIVPPEVHDIYARNDTVWVAEGGQGSYSLWDVRNKSAPWMITRFSFPGAGYAHNIWPSADGRYAVTTEETSTKTVKLWDVSNLTDIHVVSQFLGSTFMAHNASLLGDYLYIAHYQAGVYVLDIDTPECPRVVASFDTYPDGQGTEFFGAWEFYAQARTGHLYAANTDGKFFIFETNTPTADFTSPLRIGQAPLSVDLISNCPDATTSWLWDLGDGSLSSEANVSHTYAPGLYTITLTTETPVGSAAEVKPDFITALAETLLTSAPTLGPGESGIWTLNLRNNVPIAKLTLPMRFGPHPLPLAIDSISFAGTRTEYFERKLIDFSQPTTGRYCVQCEADRGMGSPPLPPGFGPIAFVHVTANQSTSHGDSVFVIIDSAAGRSLLATTITTAFVPGVSAAPFSICGCPCPADPICDGRTDIQDVIEIIEVAFRGNTPLGDPFCPIGARSDVDCSGETDVLDVVGIVDVAFRGIESTERFCLPCDY